ncbi:MAG: radical SAM family heme chaperone HemW [Clostridia bacterium]|nr:radical SAM family heme chaperone HemW [Clostridia bacterium]
MIGVYVHIPYCLRKCRYCDFVSVPIDETAGRYRSAVLREIELCAQKYPGERVKSVFFGGGTPTALPADDLCAILDAIKTAFPVEPDAEISIECNPKTIGYEGLSRLVSTGFNRLSIGLQATQNDLLNRIGRVHTFEEFLSTYRAAKDAGFQNINIDLMHGLPGQTQADYLDAIRTVAALEPAHISAYSLILEEGTPLYDDVLAGRETLPEEDAVADMEDAGMDLLEELGYHRYEVSNFAKPGFECRHNLIYWHNEPYLGLGAAAHSSMIEDGLWVRFSNESSIPAYLKKLEKGKLPRAERIITNTFEQMFESVMLGLRLTEGIGRKAFFDRFGSDVIETYREAYDKNDKYGFWDHADPAYLRLTRSGMDHLDSVLRDFRERRLIDFLR